MITVFNQYVSLKHVLLVCLEALLMVSALLAAVWLRFWNNPAEAAAYLQMPGFGFQALTVVLIFQGAFYCADHYNAGAFRGRWERLLSVAEAIGAACLLLGGIYYVAPGLLIGRGVFFISTALVLGSVVVTRLAVDRVWQATAPQQNVLLLGTGPLAVTVASELERRHDLNLRVAGFVSPAADMPAAAPGVRIVGTAADLEEIVRLRRAASLVVALEDRRGTIPTRELVRLRMSGLRIQDAHSVIESLTGAIHLDTLRPSWFVFTGGFNRSLLTRFLKRTGDVAISLAGLVLAAPVMAAVALAVRLDSRGPVLYRQERVGLKGRTFQLLKFRSMRVDAESQSGARWAVRNDSRVTRIGGFLRKYRLDELPQFLNILRGEMSCVGPRPERPVFVEQLNEQLLYYRERHSIRPGLTGWAQVQYHYGASLEDARRKLEYDLFYVKNMSLLFDITIVLKTARTVLGGQKGW